MHFVYREYSNSFLKYKIKYNWKNNFNWNVFCFHFSSTVEKSCVSSKRASARTTTQCYSRSTTRTGTSASTRRGNPCEEASTPSQKCRIASTSSRGTTRTAWNTTCRQASRSNTPGSSKTCWPATGQGRKGKSLKHPPDENIQPQMLLQMLDFEFFWLLLLFPLTQKKNMSNVFKPRQALARFFLSVDASVCATVASRFAGDRL